MEPGGLNAELRLLPPKLQVRPLLKITKRKRIFPQNVSFIYYCHEDLEVLVETTVQWRHVITDCVCLVTEMASFSVCSSRWLSWCDAVFLFQLLHLGSAAVPRLSFQLSHSLPISLSLFPFLSFSHWHWAPLPSLTIWASPPRKRVCVSVSACACVHMQTGMCEREFELLLKRACMSMFVCLGLCVWFCVSIEGSSFARWTAAT